MSRSGSAPSGHDDTDIRVKTQRIRRRSFWSGVLQGLSGPAMLADRPRGVDAFVEIGRYGVRLKPLGGRRSLPSRSRPDAMELARALARATADVGRERGLTTGAEAASRLDPAAEPGAGHRGEAQRGRSHGPR